MRFQESDELLHYLVVAESSVAVFDHLPPYKKETGTTSDRTHRKTDTSDTEMICTLLQAGAAMLNLNRWRILRGSGVEAESEGIRLQNPVRSWGYYGYSHAHHEWLFPCIPGSTY